MVTRQSCGHDMECDVPHNPQKPTLRIRGRGQRHKARGVWCEDGGYIVVRGAGGAAKYTLMKLNMGTPSNGGSP